MALPMAAVDEVVPAAGVRPLPGTRAEVAGVLVRQGRVFGIVVPAAEDEEQGSEVVILRGHPGLGLLVRRVDAVTQEFRVEEGVVRCRQGAFPVLDPEELRRRLGAASIGESDGKQDPAGR